MQELIIGTTNEAKIAQIRGALKPLNIQVAGLPKTFDLPKINEDGKTAQDNARKKALAYSKCLGKTVLSMDNALYLDGLKDDEQPGLNVRRIPNSECRPSDEELLAYYVDIVNQLGGKKGKVNGRWEFAICFANASGEIKETTIISPRTFVAKPCADVIKGYPLESIQMDPGNGKYIAEMSQDEQDEFWQRSIGKELNDFVSEAIDFKVIS